MLDDSMGGGSTSEADPHAEHAELISNTKEQLAAADAHHTLLAESCDRAFLCIIWGPRPPVEAEGGQSEIPFKQSAAVDSTRTIKDSLGQSIAQHNTTSCSSLIHQRGRFAAT